MRYRKPYHEYSGPGDASPPEDPPEWACFGCQREQDEDGPCEQCGMETRRVK